MSEQTGKAANPGDAATGPLVLVVDDNNFSRRLIVQILQTAGFQTLEAASGPAALDLLRTTPHIRLLTLDLDMPTMDGFQVLQAVRAPENAAAFRARGNTDVPVILVTANDTYANRKRGFELGAADFVRKDVVQEQLAQTARLLVTPSAVFSDMTVLVAEDSPLARYIIISCVRQFGVTVVEAADGAAALELLRQQGQHLDLVITDQHMPQLSGEELCQLIRHELGLKDLPVIVLSGTSDHETKLRLFRAGASDYLEKPFIKEELAARLLVYLKRQQLDRNLRAGMIHLKELDKLKDEFLSVCSHDLRSPMNSILGFADILLRQGAFTAEQQDMLRMIRSSGQQLLELINDILDLGRAQAHKETMEFTPLDAAELLGQCAGSFRPQAEQKKLNLRFLNNAGVLGAPISGNRAALTRVITNLISNAIKFTPEGGRIDLRVSRDFAAKLVVLECSDSGIGIPPDMLPKLFNRFSKASRSGTQGEAGTGLGLVITRELIEAHGGKLLITSREGQGSTFTIQLPLAAPAAAAPEPAAVPVAAPGVARSLNILLAEDNPANQRLMTYILEKAGHKVQTARNGKEAVDQVESLATRFDVVLMDIEMPEMDGRAATAAIRALEAGQHRPALPIIALTAHNDLNAQQEFLASGFNAILTKPINPADIHATLARLAT
jgi:CheY-like chemotaxis protein